MYIYAHILSHILFWDGLSQDVEHSSLSYTVGPCCLSIPPVMVCSANSKFPVLPLPPLEPLWFGLDAGDPSSSGGAP